MPLTTSSIFFLFFILSRDKIIADLTKRIASLENNNQILLGKLKVTDEKRQNKFNDLHSQLERLKMKFTAQSTLLDNVMTANEELTTQNEEMEGELQKHHNAHIENNVNHENGNHRAVGITNYEARNKYLEDRVKILEAELEYARLYQPREAEQQPQLDRQKGTDSQESNSSNIIVEDQSCDKQDPSSSLDETNNPSDEDKKDGFNSSTCDSLDVHGGGKSIGVDGQGRPTGFQQISSQEANTCGNTITLKYQHDVGSCSNIIDDKNNDNINESFESVSSLVLMERILELENALHERDMTAEERAGFVLTLQTRVQRLIERGYVREYNDTGDQ